MKKVICLIFAMIVLCGQVFASENYIPDDVIDTEYENAYKVLKGLSIFDRNDDSSFRPLTPITRADFAVAIGNIMNNMSLDGNMYFKDVPREHKAFEAVSKLAGYGIISGFDDKTFHPDENIKAVDAVVMLLSTMGYAKRAESFGGYPDGYIKIASSIGLLKGVRFENSGELLRGETAKMLSNSLELPVMTAELNGNYVVDNNKNFLYVAMGIKKIKGTVQANSTYSVDGGAVVRKNNLRIDDDIYRIDNKQWEDMVGYNVTCYYSDDDGENEVIYLYKNDAMIKEITVSAKNVDHFAFPYFYYTSEASSARKKITVSADLYVIYNGMLKTDVSASDFCPDSGELDFIDNESDGTYDIVKIRSYKNALVSSVTADAIYISYPTNDKIEIGDYETFAVYNMDGDIVGHLELKENDVISMYESIDKSMLRIVYSRERITGTVSDCREEDGITNLTIDDAVYEVAFDYDSSFPNLTSVGTKGTFCLDAYGNIYVMLGEKSNTRRYGYIVKLKQKKREDAYCVWLLEETGKVTERPLAEKVKLDGVSSVKPDAAYGLLSGVVLSPVVYRTNKMGEITMLDTISSGAISDDDDKLSKSVTGISGMYRKATMSFDVKLPIDENTKIFLIPENPEYVVDNNFGFANYKILENETTYYKIDSYMAGGNNKLTADILVMGVNASLKTKIGIVTGRKKVVNEDDEIVSCYKLQTSDGVMSYNVAEEKVCEEIQKITAGSGNDTTSLADSGKLLRVEIGDLVKIYCNGDGNIEKISMIYDEDADKVYSRNPNVDDVNVVSFERYVFGKISDIDRNIVKLEVSSGNYQYYNLNGKKIYIYDEGKRKEGYIKEGRMGDLRKGNNIAIITKGGVAQYAFYY